MQERDSEIDRLIRRVARLPGLGPRSARRIVLYALRKRETVLQPLIEQLAAVSEAVKECSICRNLDVVSPCHICANSKRDQSIICVVEDVADVWAMERSGLYRGLYHVLGGVLSAIDGTGPEALGIDALLARAKVDEVSEVILATAATMDGQTTAFYIMQELEPYELAVTRLAQGIPIGSELDYVDEGTLSAALQARRAM